MLLGYKLHVFRVLRNVHEVSVFCFFEKIPRGKKRKIDYNNANSIVTWNTIMSTTLACSAFLSSDRGTTSSHIG